MLDNLVNGMRRGTNKIILISSILAGAISGIGCTSGNITGPDPKPTPAVNKPPIIYQIPQQNLREYLKEQTLYIPIEASDPENDPLTVKVKEKTGIFANADIQNPNIKQQIEQKNTYESTVNIPPYTSGSGTITYEFSDGTNTTTATATVNVAKNQAPLVQDVYLEADEGFNDKDIEIPATDPEGDEISYKIDGTDKITIVDLPENKKKVIVEDKDYNGESSHKITATDSRGATTSTAYLRVKVNGRADYRGNVYDALSGLPVGSAEVSLTDSSNNTVASAFTNANGEFNLENTVRESTSTNSNGNSYTLNLRFQKDNDFVQRSIGVKPKDANMKVHVVPKSWADQTTVTRDGKKITYWDAFKELWLWNNGNVTIPTWRNVSNYEGREDTNGSSIPENLIESNETIVKELAPLFDKDPNTYTFNRTKILSEVPGSYVIGPQGLAFIPNESFVIVSYNNNIGGQGGISIDNNLVGNELPKTAIRFKTWAGKGTQYGEWLTAFGGNGNPYTQYPKGFTILDEQEYPDELSTFDLDSIKIASKWKPRIEYKK